MSMENATLRSLGTASSLGDNPNTSPLGASISARGTPHSERDKFARIAMRGHMVDHLDKDVGIC